MLYVPYGPRLAELPHIMVDSGHIASTVLCLSHWPGNTTPPELKADTSTGIVANWAARGAEDEIRGRGETIRAVSADHYDLDGLFALWGALHPADLLAHRRLVTEASVTGDFDAYTSDVAAKICLTLDALERESLQPIVAHSHWSTERVTAYLYARMLPQVSDVIADPDAFEHLWAPDWAHCQASRAALRSGAGELREQPSLGLAVVRSPGPLHPYAVHEATPLSTVLVVEGGVCRLYYRYEGFVDLATRTAGPRTRLDGLIERLNGREQHDGEWWCENIVTAHPCLQFYGSEGSRSSISPDEFEKMVVEHFYEHADDPSMQWRSSHGWLDESQVMPPSRRNPCNMFVGSAN